MRKSELKPCKSCGWPPKVDSTGKYYCDCKKDLLFDMFRVQAIERWNKEQDGKA